MVILDDISDGLIEKDFVVCYKDVVFWGYYIVLNDYSMW